MFAKFASLVTVPYLTPPPPQNELNALSQYNDTAYYPNTDTYFNTIQAKVQDFFKANIQESLRELENYIIDFYVTPDKVRGSATNGYVNTAITKQLCCQLETVRWLGLSDVFSWMPEYRVPLQNVLELCILKQFLYGIHIYIL